MGQRRAWTRGTATGTSTATASRARSIPGARHPPTHPSPPPPPQSREAARRSCPRSRGSSCSPPSATLPPLPLPPSPSARRKPLSSRCQRHRTRSTSRSSSPRSSRGARAPLYKPRSRMAPTAGEMARVERRTLTRWQALKTRDRRSSRLTGTRGRRRRRTIGSRHSPPGTRPPRQAPRPCPRGGGSSRSGRKRHPRKTPATHASSPRRGASQSWARGLRQRSRCYSRG
mmetsp:Transcript_64484/g.153803  ORF Transcript_64484/g.153803 Transcript_64484/m.153803 type:complete len:229 (+) Transcript_64484:59-745(+)